MKSSVQLRERKLKNGNLSLYLDIYYKGKRSYEYLRLYVPEKPKTAKERELKRERLAIARNIAVKRETELLSGEYGLKQIRNTGANFIEYCENYVKSYTKADIRSITSAFKQFRRFVGNDVLPAREIDERLLRRFLDYLFDNFHGTTPRSYFARFKKIVKAAREDGLFPENPARNIQVPQKESVEKAILNNDEIRSLYAAKCNNQVIKAAFLFGLNTGLGYSEVKSLNWSNIDGETLVYTRPKTKKTIVIPLNGNAIKILNSIDKIGENVFPLPTYNGCKKHLVRWLKRAGITKNVTWHSVRHSFAVNLLLNGNDVKTVSGLLGHSSITQTEKYLHFIDEMKRKAVDSLPEME